MCLENISETLKASAINNISGGKCFPLLTDILSNDEDASLQL